MRKNQITRLIALGVLLVVAVLGMYYYKRPLGAKAIVNGRTIPLELAVTPSEKEKGLGYRDSLPEETGMLFIYDHKEIYPYWMRGMRFPIDIIWISDNTIVDIDANVPIPTTDDVNKLPIYHPDTLVDKVLELNAGKAAEWGIAIGDTVVFKQ